MSEETKEILHCIETNCKHNKCFGSVKLDKEECELLLDDITNLQQENERFKADEKFFTDCGFTNIEQLSIAYNDYKSKKDKATTLYLKELSEKGKVDDLACRMFNTLEGNIK